MYFLLTSYFSQLNQEVQPDLVMLSYQPSSKEYDSDYSDDDDDDNEMYLLNSTQQKKINEKLKLNKIKVQLRFQQNS
jgi:hypothetical protein